MKYKALKEIGGYKVGEEVPAEKAEAWLGMYSVPHVELVSEGPVPDEEVAGEPEPAPGEAPPEEVEGSGDAMLEDYLARNVGVVKKNVEEDELSEAQLKGLLELESSGKQRRPVLKALKKRLKELD